ncbi:MAG: hypothetical protein LBP53_08495 [Candidatus Peribacteria bacterium]|nr:hypothetical protein [Candidatus Peribacteria bacterium]
MSIKHNPTYLIHPQDSNFSYLIENINLSVNGRPFTYTYQLIYQDDIPSQTISLEDINGSAYGTGYQSIRADGLLDIKSQPIDGCVRYLQTFINEGTSKKRTYTIKGINFQEIIDEHTNATDATSNENAEQQKQALTTISGSMIPNVP